MTDQPKIASLSPAHVELEAGQTYFFCTCGESENQPFCDGAHGTSGFTPHMFEATETGKAWLCTCKHTKDTPFCDGAHKELRRAQDADS